MSRWSPVYACTVVITPWRIPIVSCSTFATGARQFVVHDAFEITTCSLGVVRVVEVDAERDGDVGLLGRRRDDHLARAGLDVLQRVGALAEQARRLDHDLDAELAPGQRRRDRLRRRPGSRRRRRRSRRRELDVPGNGP